MESCTDHDCVVVFDGRKCPVCRMQKELDTANETIEARQERIEELENDLEDLRTEVSND